VNLPNLDLKLGISYLEREGEGGEGETDRKTQRQKLIHKEREGEKADNKNQEHKRGR
jgi:hypothetical protein